MTEDAKTVKLTKQMEDSLRYLVKRGTVTKSMMDSYGPRLNSYEALVNRGLADRPPMSAGPYTPTEQGRAHPAVTAA